MKGDDYNDTDNNDLNFINEYSASYNKNAGLNFNQIKTQLCFDDT